LIYIGTLPDLHGNHAVTGYTTSLQLHLRKLNGSLPIENVVLEPFAETDRIGLPPPPSATSSSARMVMGPTRPGTSATTLWNQSESSRPVTRGSIKATKQAGISRPGTMESAYGSGGGGGGLSDSRWREFQVEGLPTSTQLDQMGQVLSGKRDVAVRDELAYIRRGEGSATTFRTQKKYFVMDAHLLDGSGEGEGE
jgi:hypothetical protein